MQFYVHSKSSLNIPNGRFHKSIFNVRPVINRVIDLTNTSKISNHFVLNFEFVSIYITTSTNETSKVLTADFYTFLHNLNI